MKHLKFLTLLLIAMMFGFASCSNDKEPQELQYDIVVDGIAYNLDLDNMTASVVEKSDPSSYSGNMSIPSTITANGREFTVNEIHQMAFFKSSITGVNLPNTITFIDYEAFRGCKNLKTIKFPNSLEFIQSYSFGESGLETVSIPPSVTTVSVNSFIDCENLKEFTIEYAPTPISGFELYASPLEIITLNRDLTKGIYTETSTLKTINIGENVTSLYTVNFIEPVTINCYALNPPSVLFNNSNTQLMECKIYVPAESIELYKADENWGKFWNIEAIK